jgi:hypothetical protein
MLAGEKECILKPVESMIVCVEIFGTSLKLGITFRASGPSQEVSAIDMRLIPNAI